MHRKSLRRTVTVALTAFALAGSAGCFGSFNIVRKVHGFNKSVSTNKFAQEIVFLAFNIIPVYGVAGLADALVANTVEFWTGKNPVQMSSRIQLDSATTLTRVVYEKNGARYMTIKAFRFDKLVSTTTIGVAGDDNVSYQTVLPDGRRVSNVMRMSEDGSAIVAGNR
jgi:hypothetical protein